MLCVGVIRVHPGTRRAYNPCTSRGRRKTLLLKLLHRVSPSLAAAGNFALSGAAFAVGNLLLARQMDVKAYASLSLCTAVFVVASQMATLGYTQVAQRQALPGGAALLIRLLLPGLLVGALVAALVCWHYGLGMATALWLMLLIAAGTLIWVVVNMLLRVGRRGWAFLVQTMTDWSFLLLGLWALVSPGWADSGAFAAYSALVILLAAGAWMVQARLVPPAGEDYRPVPWSVLWSSTAIVGGGVLLSQIERLTVGFLLQPGDLAMVAVLASIAVFAFRLVNTGVGFVLTPSLRRIADVEGRRRLVRHELRVIGGTLLLATVGICLLGPYVARWITAGQYEPGLWLLLAACLAGAAKVLHGIPRAIIVACGTNEELARLSRFMWLGVAFAVLGAVAGRPAGLIGVLAGIAAGSMLGAIPGARLAQRVLRAPPMPGAGETPRAGP